MNFALCGSYSLLSPETKSQIVTECEERGLLNDIRRSLAPLALLYDDFPMAFLGIGDFDVRHGVLLQELKQTVGKCINNYETPGLMLQTNLIMVQAVTGGLSISNDIQLPDFASIIKDPAEDKTMYRESFLNERLPQPMACYCATLREDRGPTEAWLRRKAGTD